MKHYYEEINLFVDCELEEEKAAEIFKHIGECQECRKLLSDLILLKEKSRTFCAENLREINKPKPENKFYKVAFYASSAAAVLLLFFLSTSKPKETYFTQNIVRVDTVYIPKEIPAGTIQNAVSFSPAKQIIKTGKIKSPYLAFIRNLKTENVTSADIVSN